MDADHLAISGATMSTRWPHFRRSRHGRKFPVADKAPLPSMPGKVDSLEYRAKQLRIALEGLGPRYSCLALYLSSRIDLLPVEYCRELALSDDVAPPLAPAEIQRLLMSEFGDAFSRSFGSFEYQPQNSSLTRQSHTARLTTGDAVTVTFLRPEYYALQDDRALRQFLDWEIVNQLCGEIAIQDAKVDFLHALRRKATLSLEREALESANQTAFDPLRARKIYHELSTPRVLTLEKIESGNLNRSLASHNHSLNALARRICKTWLGQAMSGNPFPVDPQAHHLVIGKDDQLFFEGCELASLPKGVIENLWNYLLAALIDDPDRSATYLLQEMYSAKRKEVDLQSFRTNFRQAAYFAALEPVLGTDSNALSQLVFQHWKTALDHGYFPKPRLLCFYRGFFSVARIAWKVSATDDAMREGMEDLQTEKIFDEVRELAGMSYWMQNADKFAGVLVNLPRTFDQALNRTSHPPQEIVIQNASDSRPRNVAAVMAIFLLIVAVLVAESAHLSGASGKIVAGVLMLAGLLTLRALSA
jgi:predicted unusual protein kinase regulating ubiquinone biosynthesis (AarF/ABC1/UbiB family)